MEKFMLSPALDSVGFWFMNNEKELMKKYPDKIGLFCFVYDDDKIDFFDDCSSQFEAFDISRQKYPDKIGLVFQFGKSSLTEEDSDNILNKIKERFRFKKEFLENYKYLIDNYSEEHMHIDFIAIFDSKIMLLTDKKNIDECFEYLHEIKAPDGALIYQRNKDIRPFINSIQFSNLTNVKKSYVDITVNLVKGKRIDKVMVNTSLDVSVFPDYRKINLAEGYKYFAIGYVNTMNSYSLMLYVDSVYIAIVGISNTQSIISIPIDYFMAYTLFKSSSAHLTDTVKRTSLVERKTDLFDLNKINEFKSWINNDFDKPDNKLKSMLNEAGIIDWSNVPNSLGLSHLTKINFYYSAVKKSMSFWDTPTSDDRVTLITYPIYRINK